MRPIDADALFINLDGMMAVSPTGYIHGETVADMISDAPTIDAEPVRHGKWTVEWETEDTRMLRCSECRMVFNVGKGRDGNYCPNCGARMDGE